MIIHSDWHIHSAASFDSSLSLEEIIQSTNQSAFRKAGIADHVNFNDLQFLNDLKKSAETVHEQRKSHPELVLGVELTPISKPEFDYIAQHNGIHDGYIPPATTQPYGIELAQTKDELIAQGIQYTIGAAHWRVDIPGGLSIKPDFEEDIREWHRQQMWLACDERVTILGHPWCHLTQLWYDDFSVIPASMNAELGAALKENGKYVECNSYFLNEFSKTSEKFRHQYAEFLRELFEMGIPVTYGSDAHSHYHPLHVSTEPYLIAAGFKDGDIVELREESLW